MLIKTLGAASLIGGRAENQDSIEYFTLSNGWIVLVVCDGMGGLNAGKLASQLAVQEVHNYCEAHFDQQDTGQLVVGAVNAAYDAIVSVSNERNLRLGTTIALLILTEEAATGICVGDSRIYQFRAGKMIFQSRDHSRVGEYVEAGLLTEEEAREHPESNILTNALAPGKFDSARSELITCSFEKKDLFLLCTDGVWNLLPARELFDLIRPKQTDAAVLLPWLLHHLDHLGHERGGRHDNLSAIAIVTATKSKQKTGNPRKSPWVIVLALYACIATALVWWVVTNMQINQQAREKIQSELNATRDSLDSLRHKHKKTADGTIPPPRRPKSPASPPKTLPVPDSTQTDSVATISAPSDTTSRL